MLIMRVDTLIEFLRTLPIDTKVVTDSHDRNCSYREVDFKFIQTIKKDGTIEKTLIVQ